MTGMSVLRQVYGLMEQPHRLAAEDGNEPALAAINQIYSNLWYREHSEAFEPLSHLWQEVALSWRCVPALIYGTAALLCLHSDTAGAYDRYLELYMRALSHTGGPLQRRVDALGGEVAGCN